jgi:hypothetical protein
MLNQATTIAQRYLNEETAQITIRKIIFKKQENWEKIYKEMKEVTVKYEALEEGQRTSVAWTNRKGDLHTIFINNIIQQRVNEIEFESDEYKITVFGCAISIVHEIAHLILRWIGFENTPPCFDGEVGFFFERYTFSYELYTMGKKKTWNTKWTKNIEIAGENQKKLINQIIQLILFLICNNKGVAALLSHKSYRKRFKFAKLSYIKALYSQMFLLTDNDFFLLPIEFEQTDLPPNIYPLKECYEGFQEESDQNNVEGADDQDSDFDDEDMFVIRTCGIKKASVPSNTY